MRKHSRIAFALFTISLLASLPLLAGTSIVHRWVITGIPMPEIKQLLIVALTDNYLFRQDFEDELASLLEKSGVKGVESHMVFPPRNELMEGELRRRIHESTLDAVLVVRPKDIRREKEEVVSGGFYTPPPGYYAFWPYWNMAYMNTYTTTTIRENTVVRAECNIYYVKDEKLIWSGESDTIMEKGFGKMGKSYAKTLYNQLKKDKVIPKK